MTSCEMKNLAIDCGMVNKNERKFVDHPVYESLNGNKLMYIQKVWATVQYTNSMYKNEIKKIRGKTRVIFELCDMDMDMKY